MTPTSDALYLLIQVASVLLVMLVLAIEGAVRILMAIPVWQHQASMWGQQVWHVVKPFVVF